MLTIPNALTFSRLLLVPCFVWASSQGMYRAACVLFVTAALTDILDGWVARRLDQRSRFGALLDPAADKLLMISGYVFYTFQQGLPGVSIPPWLTFTVFIRDFLLVLFAYLLYTRVQIKKFPPSAAGKASTLLQAVTLGMVIAVNGFWPQLLIPAQVFFRLTVVVTLYSAWGYMRRAARTLEDGSGVLA